MTPLGGVLAKLAEGFVAVNGFAVLQIRNSLSYLFVHLFWRVILAEVARFSSGLVGRGSSLDTSAETAGTSARATTDCGCKLARVACPTH